MFLATGFYSGYLPKAPGTWGSLVALPIHFALIHLAFPNYLIGLNIIILLAILVAGSAEKILDRADPSVVVIDEIAGMLIALAGTPANPLIWILGFAIFRFFDILKPWPVNFFDRNLHGGLGIVLDDLMAGLYTMAVLQIIIRLAGWS